MHLERISQACYHPLMSNPEARDSRTLAFYGAEAPVYTASGPGGTSRFLQGFLDRLTPGARVLELGCGGGRDSEAMLAAGFDVLPTDGVPEVARQAEMRLGRPVQVMRFDEMTFENEFDAVFANASLLHVPRSALAGVLEMVHRALRPGGIHFANFKAGGTEGRDEHGRYFNFLSHEQMLTFYERGGRWEVIESTEYMGGGYQHGQIPWVSITARKLP